jgi:hypothetical protein
MTRTPGEIIKPLPGQLAFRFLTEPGHGETPATERGGSAEPRESIITPRAGPDERLERACQGKPAGQAGMSRTPAGDGPLASGPEGGTFGSGAGHSPTG